ncbi:MAG: ubiquinone/menaquinone biosynthesis protein [Gammaproteobacteria bacterium]|nr:ubiquinone/menaquinone biosynthesis protein [Gammaproteobacteria bacterium]
MAKIMHEHPSNIPENPSCDNRPLWDIWLSGFRLPALTVADEIGLFAFLDDQPSPLSAIAARLGFSERACEALIHLLCALGFVAKRNDLFYLSELSRNYLLPNSPYYWGGVLNTVKHMPVSHGMILEALRRDTDGNTRLTKPFTEDWENNSLAEEKARSFTAKMHSHGFSAAVALAQSGRLRGFRRLLDIGGGSGCYSIALAAINPDLHCTVADLPVVCPITQQYIDSFRLSERVRTLALDMFNDPWPHTQDAILFSDILHDWERSRCLWLIRNSFDSLPSGGQIFLHEVLLEDDKIGPLTANAYSLAMLLVTKGQQFTAGELEAMLSAAGFTDISSVPSHAYYSLISGRKP